MNKPNKMRLGVFFGGKSGEHEVSLMSAAAVIDALDKTKYDVKTFGITRDGVWLFYDGPTKHIADGSWQREAEEALRRDEEKYGFHVLSAGGRSLRDMIDFALPILHGPYGEDGTIQGLFEMVGIPYGGCDVIGSALAMDKIAAKQVFSAMDLRQVPYVWLEAEDLPEKAEWMERKIKQRLHYPVFVKPANMGSSVGLSKVNRPEELKAAIDLACRYDRRIIIEQGIDCRELETAVLGNHSVEVSAVGEIISDGEFYDYESKYSGNGKSSLSVPAQITDEQREEIRSVAVQAYKALDCRGCARVDFMLDKNTGEIYLNEINTIPGFTPYSMFARLWDAVGVPFSETIDRIIELGMERYRVKSRQETAADCAGNADPA